MGGKKIIEVFLSVLRKKNSQSLYYRHKHHFFHSAERVACQHEWGSSKAGVLLQIELVFSGRYY